MNEIRGLVRLAAQATAGAATTLHGVHRGITDRCLSPAGPSLDTVRATHDRVASLAYGSVGAGARAVRGLADVANVLPAARPLSRSRRGSQTLAVLNGLFGDRLAADRDLGLPMAVVVDGREIDVDTESLASAFPDATARIAVFVHGLCASEAVWRRASRDAAGMPLAPYGDRLATDLGITPVYMRYNTGLRIGVNGRALDAVLTRLVRAWPKALDEISIVGHSMGGLVARSGCHRADANASPWKGLLRHIVYLASPHQGAPLERFVERVTPALGRLPETALIAAILDVRSAGIRDLRFGAPRSDDINEPPHTDEAAVPLPSDVDNHVIVATVSKEPSGLLARLIGDGLVLVPSASGPRTNPYDTTRSLDVRHVGKAGHTRILNHPDVYDQLATWLA